MYFYECWHYLLHPFLDSPALFKDYCWLCAQIGTYVSLPSKFFILFRQNKKFTQKIPISLLSFLASRGKKSQMFGWPTSTSDLFPLRWSITAVVTLGFVCISRLDQISNWAQRVCMPKLPTWFWIWSSKPFLFLPSLILGFASPFSFPSTQLTIYLKVSSTCLHGLPHSLVATCHLIPNIRRKADILYGKLVHI